MKSANSPTVPFFPTGRAFFIYIGEHEARKGENTNIKSPRAFWKHSRKTQHLSERSQVVFEFTVKRQLWGENDLLGNVQWLWLEDEGLPFCRLWMRRKGERLCNCNKASWNFSVSFVSKQENKVLKKPCREGEASGSFFPPYWGTAVAVSQPFPSVFLWIFLPGANRIQQK